jgi:hypothetical protein
MLVWFTDWQVSEDHVLIRVGDVVEWTLYRSDRDWLTQLFADRLTIDWKLDTYGDAIDQPFRRVRGEVTELLSVHCRQMATDQGLVPVPGEARLLPVPDTSGSWMRDDGVAKGPLGYETFDDLYGYVLRVEISDDGGEVTGEADAMAIATTAKPVVDIDRGRARPTGLGSTP